MAKGYSRVYVSRKDKSLILGSIDIRNQIVTLQDGKTYTPENILEEYKIYKEPKKKSWKTVEEYKYDPICGEFRYFEKKVWK